MHVHAGIDTYGRVKSVAGTAIVTKFFMLQLLPIYPIRSYYVTGTHPSKADGIPWLAAELAEDGIGIPLARRDVVSVIVAYLRGIFGAMAVIGFIFVLFPGISYLSGGRLDDFALAAMRVALVLLAAGAAGGSLTYAIPSTPRRESEIRRYCEEILGLAADPARVASEKSRLLIEHVDDTRDAESPRRQLIRRLVEARAEIAQGTDAMALEARCDEWLDQLRHAERPAG